MRRRARRTAGFVGLLVLASCGSGDRPLDRVDPDAAPLDPTYDQVYAIIERECVPCHGDGGDDAAGSLRGPPSERESFQLGVASGADPDLTTCRAIIDNLAAVERQIERNAMPPGAWPRLTSEEKLLIERWIENGARAPCNP